MRAAPLLLFAVLLSLSACAGAQTSQSLNSVSSGPASVGPASPQESMADLQLRAGRADLALLSYDRALQARPADVGLGLKRARVLLRLGRVEEALEGFTRLVVMFPVGGVGSVPAETEARLGAGECLYRLARHEEARGHLARAVELAPEHWRARCYLGLALQASGRSGEAAEEFRTALGSPQLAQLSDQARKAVREELANNLGVALVLAGDLQGGVVIFRKAMDRGLGSERVCNNLGLLLVRLGRNAEALEAFRAAGDEARALNNMGYALLLKGEARPAQAMFEKALEVSPAYYATAGENLKRSLLASSRDRQAPAAFPGAAGISLSPATSATWDVTGKPGGPGVRR